MRVVAFLCLAFGCVLLYPVKNRAARSRLAALDPVPTDLKVPCADRRSIRLLERSSDWLARSGCFTYQQRRAIYRNIGFIAVMSLSTSLILAAQASSISKAVIASAAAGFVGIAATCIYVRFRMQSAQQKVAFEVPLLLEKLILLVESGFDILAAVEKLVSQISAEDPSPTLHFLDLAYRLAGAGMPFGQSLELVANRCGHPVITHVFLHLDITGNNGGELVPALRSLSSHTHREWKLGVESRVKRLETLVVFPVFLSVIGLILLVAAVPLVPILQLRDQIHENKVVSL